MRGREDRLPSPTPWWAQAAVPPGRVGPAVHLSVDSAKPLADLAIDLVAACEANGLRVVKRAAERGPGAVIVELADPFPEIQAATDTPPGRDASTYKIAAYQTPAGHTRVSTIRPTHLMDLLGHPELAAAALRVERALERALQTAAGWTGPKDLGERTDG